MRSIKIKQWPIELSAGRNETVLDTALRAGVPFPHNCRSGECGECKVKLVAGEIDHDHYLDGALSQTERDQGFVLACRSRPKSDLQISWVKDLDTQVCIPVKKYRGKISFVEQVAFNVTLIRIIIRGTPMAFAAGQYANIGIGKLPMRSYSMASQPSADEIEFHIRHVPGGLVSGYIAEHLKVGEKLRLEGPYGTSYLRENHEGPIVAAAGGTGLAPVLSIVRQALLRGHDRPVHIYFGVQDESAIYCEECLKELAAVNTNVNLQIVFSDTDKQHARRKGFIHEAIDADIADMTDTKIYAAGPPPMIDALTKVVISKGANADDIHSDPFTSSGDNSTSDPEQTGFLSRLFGR
jgi:CDP-4-dehydro-6-deoxyglucose reductase/ferredoxin-NAD(P)+ reductase (naphthalene dioxygenase ferredoxin-specific)